MSCEIKPRSPGFKVKHRRKSIWSSTIVFFLGLADVSDIDNKTYTTLLYANGPGYNYTVVDGSVSRWNISEDPVTDDYYNQLAALPLSDESHGGDDVLIYARGKLIFYFIYINL